MNVVVVSPHRDDAAFSATLSVRSLLRAGHGVTVLNCFTRSDYAPFADTTFVHANDRVSFVSALRLREDEAWRLQQTSTSLTFFDLNLKDAPLRLRCPLDEIRTRDMNPDDKAIRKIRKSLDQLSPAALLLPLALGGHVDHRTARQAAVQHDPSMAIAFYEDLPYAAWPDVEPTVAVCAETLSKALAIPLSPMTTPSAAEAAAAEKLRAALCYDSQIDNATAQLIANFSLRYGGAERLWVNEAWLALPTQLLAA